MYNVQYRDLDFETIPLGTFWNNLNNEAPNRYEYEAMLTKFFKKSH